MKKKKQSKSLPNNDLPMELVAEVLARLPVKSLLRFRVVCKSWHSLISSPDFASLHLARFHKDNVDDENTPVLTHTFWRTHQWKLHSSRTCINITSKFGRRLDKGNLEYPMGFYPRGESVNGLIVLLRNVKAESQMMLWNPILGKTHKLPTPPICGPFLGLGFSLSTNDYKVVAISRDWRAPSVHLYSLSTGTWKSIVNYRTEIISCVHSDGVLIEHTMFWVTEEYFSIPSVIVSFDVDNEMFDYIAMPPIDSKVFEARLVAYRKWVGLLAFHHTSCSLWVMEKDQVPGSWSKLYTMDLEQQYVFRMISFKKNGQFILASRPSGTVLCSIETQHRKRLLKGCLFPRKGTFFCTLYKESLLLL